MNRNGGFVRASTHLDISVKGSKWDIWFYPDCILPTWFFVSYIKTNYCSRDVRHQRILIYEQEYGVKSCGETCIQKYTIQSWNFSFPWLRWWGLGDTILIFLSKVEYCISCFSYKWLAAGTKWDESTPPISIHGNSRKVKFFEVTGTYRLMYLCKIIECLRQFV